MSRLLVCLLAIAAGCRALPGEAMDVTGQAIPPGHAVGPGGTAANANARFAATRGFAQASVATGVVVRWKQDPNRCLARSSATVSAGDAVVMAQCAATQTQAWSLLDGHLAVDSNWAAGIDSASPNGIVLVSTVADYQQALAFSFNGGATTLSDAYGKSSYLQAGDANGTYGLKAQTSPTYTPGTLRETWDIVGTSGGGADHGSPLYFQGSARGCLAKGGAGVSLVTCDANQSNQRWSMVRGDLANDAGGCLVGDTNTSMVSIIDCASVSNTADNNQGWYANTRLQYAFASATKAITVLLADPANGNVWLAPVVDRVTWHWGANKVGEQ